MSTPFRKVAVIFNPTARHGEAARLEPRIREKLAGRIEYVFKFTESRRHAEALTREAIAEGCDLIVAAGGDGTYNEVANGIMAEGGKAAIAVLPLGSGNDYCRTLGMSKELEAALEETLRGRTKRVDVGVCNGVHFVNNISMGLDGNVAHRAHTMKEETGRAGIGLYMASLFDVLRKDYHGYSGTVTFDDEPARQLSFLIFCVTNGPTYGGGFQVAPQAVNGDGDFDYCYVDDLPLRGALWRIPFIVVGRHNGMKVVHTGKARRVRLLADLDVEAELDGEPYTWREFDIQILERVLTAVTGDRRVY